jgi:hypothetical protein
MSAQPGAVLIFNNNTFVILTAMTGKQGGECIIGAFVTDDNNNEAKPIAGIAMAGILVTAALLLSGLSLITSNQQPVIAQQQNMTGGGGVTEGGATITDNTDNTTDITGSAAQGGNATAIAGGVVGGNQSEVRMHIEEARIALQNNDTQGALMQLDLALSTLGGAGGTQGNMTTGTTIAGTDATNTNSEDGIPPVGGTSATDEDNEIADNDAADGNDDESNSNTDANRRETDTEEDSECGGVTVGGTSAADDYGCPPDPDA